MYRVIGDTAMLLHFAFLVYVLFGGFLAWRWPRSLTFHLPCALYALGIVVIGWTCPLTVVEMWARERVNGREISEGGFIAHYLTGVVYPEHYLLHVQVLVGTLVVLSWIGLAWWRSKNSRDEGERSVR